MRTRTHRDPTGAPAEAATGMCGGSSQTMAGSSP